MAVGPTDKVRANPHLQSWKLPHYAARVSASQLKKNLIRLLKDIKRALAAAGVKTPPGPRCVSLAQRLPLAHSTTERAFLRMAADDVEIGRKLLSPAKLDERGIKKLRLDSAEVALGTTQFVFLYRGQFRYPNTSVGLLFSKSLEEGRSADAVASPFDSGALHCCATWPDASEPAVAFLARHTLPVPAYREYMASRIQDLFADPAQYLDPESEPIGPDPIGLRPKPPATKADARFWTFEVRVRDEVALAPPHLEVVFYRGRVKGSGRFFAFLRSLKGKVRMEPLRPDDPDDFRALQRQCLEYLRDRGIIEHKGV
jgi:hypothetical protein